MSGRIIAKGPHQCEPSNAFASCGDIWECDDCGRTWRCVYMGAGKMWRREMPWSRWLRERRQRRVEGEPMRENSDDE